MEFLNNLPISVFDIFMIALGVIAILFGLIGKAPRKIFRLIFIIAALVAAYFINKYVGATLYDTIMGIDAVKGALSSVTEYVSKEVLKAVVNALVFWLIGIVCLIFIPLIGNSIVRAATRKSKKGTAKWTFGIPSLLSTAIVWTFLLLPIILLVPLTTKENIDNIGNAIGSLMSSSNDSNKEKQDGGDAKTASFKAGSKVIVLGETDTPAEDNSESSGGFDINQYVGEGTIGGTILAQINNSKYLTFTSTKGVEAVEKTMTTLTGKTFKFLAVDMGEGKEPIGLIATLQTVISKAGSVLAKLGPIDLSNPTSLLGNLGDVKAEDLSALIASLSDVASLSPMLQSKLADYQGIISQLSDTTKVEAILRVTEAIDIEALMSGGSTGDTNPLAAVGGLLTGTKDEIKANLGAVLGLVSALPEEMTSEIAEGPAGDILTLLSSDNALEEVATFASAVNLDVILDNTDQLGALLSGNTPTPKEGEDPLTMASLINTNYFGTTAAEQAAATEELVKTLVESTIIADLSSMMVPEESQGQGSQTPVSVMLVAGIASVEEITIGEGDNESTINVNSLVTNALTSLSNKQVNKDDNIYKSILDNLS